MKLIKTMLAILFVAVLLAGCAPAGSPTTPVSPSVPESKPVVAPVVPSGPLEFTNPAQRIKVPVGVTFVINVNSNPTTGYTWEVGFDQGLLKLVKRYTPSSSGLIGAGGVESFEFQGMKTGETEVYLNYKRPFEPNNPALETKTFKVTVE